MEARPAAWKILFFMGVLFSGFLHLPPGRPGAVAVLGDPGVSEVT
jgi:hypothetical protein